MTSTAAPSKAVLRTQALARRRALPPQARDDLTRRLTQEGLRLASHWAPSAISAFYPVRGEPDTLMLFAALVQAGFATALPAVVGRDTHLEFRRWRPGDQAELGPMGIPEPLATAGTVEPDMLFVPLACFDRRGHRIGYGAGFFDRSLERLRAVKRIRAIGVAYGVCEVAAVPYEPHDQLLDAVVTEQETFFTGER